MSIPYLIIAGYGWVAMTLVEAGANRQSTLRFAIHGPPATISLHHSSPKTICVKSPMRYHRRLSVRAQFPLPILLGFFIVFKDGAPPRLVEMMGSTRPARRYVHSMLTLRVRGGCLIHWDPGTCGSHCLTQFLDLHQIRYNPR
jgi:hypothetical protein